MQGGIMAVPPVERVVAAARQQGQELTIHEFPAGTRTADDAARAVGVDVGQIVKSLVFMADGEPVVVLTSGRNRVDTRKVARLLGARAVGRADADQARKATGYVIGGTPPFGHTQRLRIFVDAALLDYDAVWAAAGTPHHVFPLTPEELVRCSDGAVADVHETRS